MEAIDYSVDEGVGLIRMVRSARRNPLDARARAEIGEVLAGIRAGTEVKALVLTGKDGVFCAGGDLADLKANAGNGPAYWRNRLKQGQVVINELALLDRPVIAAVDGPAFGAGLSLALTADMIVASTRASFNLSFLKLGLVPDFGALYALPRVVGVQRAKELMFSARDVGAEEAKAMGIVMEVHAPEALEARAMDIARSFTRASAAALALIKGALNTSMDSSREAMADLEAVSQAAAFSTPEPLAAIDMLLNKKAPPFRWPAAPAPR